MNYLKLNLLNKQEISTIESEIKKKDQLWQDGKRTAGSHAREVKNNLQIDRDSELSRKYTNLISRKILSHPLIKSFTIPKIIHSGMFTKSCNGMHYGRHIDNPYMSAGRADLSFTIFISEKDNYSGGELVVENINTEERFKLNSGDIIIYPSTYLHSVSKIEKGERIVFVGWIESYVRSIEEREYLFDLDAGARSLLKKYGRSDELDLIFKSYSNILRVLGN